MNAIFNGLFQVEPSLSDDTYQNNIQKLLSELR